MSWQVYFGHFKRQRGYIMSPLSRHWYLDKQKSLKVSYESRIMMKFWDWISETAQYCSLGGHKKSDWSQKCETHEAEPYFKICCIIESATFPLFFQNRKILMVVYWEVSSYRRYYCLQEMPSKLLWVLWSSRSERDELCHGNIPGWSPGFVLLKQWRCVQQARPLKLQEAVV